MTHFTTTFALTFLLFASEALVSPVPIFKRAPGRVHPIPATRPGGYNESYGYPDGIGGLIIEGPGPGTDFPVWSDSNRWGAYGMLIAPGTFKQGSACSAVPASSPFAGQQPVKMTNSIKDCLIGCNTTEIQRTGKDLCRVGSVSPPLSNSPMSCFELGPGTVAGGGACGYNCSLLVGHRGSSNGGGNTGPTPCSKADADAGKCLVYCDSRTFPGQEEVTLID